MFWGHIKGQQLCIKYTWYQHLNFCNRSQIFVWHLNDKDYPKPWTYCSMFYSNGEPTSLYICYSTIIVSDLLSMLNTKLKFLIRFKNICGWGYISPFRQAFKSQIPPISDNFFDTNVETFIKLISGPSVKFMYLDEMEKIN